jgi:hypothetical protein
MIIMRLPGRYHFAIGLADEMIVGEPVDAWIRNGVESIDFGNRCFAADAPDTEAASSEGAERDPWAEIAALRKQLEQLGYLRCVDGSYSLTTKVLEIGTAGIACSP